MKKIILSIFLILIIFNGIAVAESSRFEEDFEGYDIGDNILDTVFTRITGTQQHYIAEYPYGGGNCAKFYSSVDETNIFKIAETGQEFSMYMRLNINDSTNYEKFSLHFLADNNLHSFIRLTARATANYFAFVWKRTTGAQSQANISFYSGDMYYKDVNLKIKFKDNTMYLKNWVYGTQEPEQWYTAYASGALNNAGWICLGYIKNPEYYIKKIIIEDAFVDINDYDDIDLLSAPEELYVTEAGTNYIRITWDDVTGADGYNVYIDDLEIDSTVNNSYTYTELVADTEYDLQVQAYQIINDEKVPGEISDVLTASTTEIEPLPAPVLNVTETSMDYITISWTPITGAVRYRIYRNGQMIDTIAGTGYTYGGLLPYVYYDLGVRAVQFYNGEYLDGKLGELTAATDVVPDLPAPDSFIVTDKNMFSISTSWEQVDDASGYFLFKNGIKISSTQQTEYTYTNLQPGTEYTLEVEAYRIIGGIVYGGDKAEIIDVTNDLSGGVTYLWLVSKHDDGAIIAWTGIDDATGYRIYRDDSLLTQVAGSKTQYTAQGLEKGQAYFFYVTSIIESVESDPSNSIEVRTQLPVYETSLHTIIGRVVSIARSMSSGIKLALAVIIAGKAILFVMYIFRRVGAKL